MASFLLQPCHLRGDRFVPSKEAPIEVSWHDLLDRLAPSKSSKAKNQLRSGMRMGGFVGLTRHSKSPEPCNFVLQNQDRSGKIGWLLKQDPSFSERLIEVFRIEALAWDDKVEELDNGQAA